jgi:hypothetical protein
MRSNLVSALCLAAGLSIYAASALAQNYDPDRVSSAGDAEAREACTPDVMRLCNDYIPDIPQIVACLKHERPNLSPACGAIFAASEPDPAPTPVKKRTPPKKKPAQPAAKTPK